MKTKSCVKEASIELENVPGLHLIMDYVIAEPEAGRHISLSIFLADAEDLVQHFDVNLGQVVWL